MEMMKVIITKIGIEKSGDGYITYASFVFAPSFMRSLWRLWNIITCGIFSGKILLSQNLGELRDIDEDFDDMQIAYDLYSSYYCTTREEAELLEIRYSAYFRSKGAYSPK
jgi:hypothetical protein